MAGKNFVNLAKGNKAKNKTVNKLAVKVEVEKPKSPEEERDLKVQETVNNLLQDFNLNPKKEDLLDITPTVETTIPEGSEWLGEQVTLLTSKMEALQLEVDSYKNDYNKIFEENQKLKHASPINLGETDKNVIRLFNEIQDNHLKMGNNFIIAPVAFLNRLIMFFPFLKEFKKFK